MAQLDMEYVVQERGTLDILAEKSPGKQFVGLIICGSLKRFRISQYKVSKIINLDIPMFE